MHKKIKVLFVLASFCTLPMLAQAKPIILSNFTKIGLGIAINQQCQPGPLQIQGEITYPEAFLKQICKDNTKNCQTQVFKGTCSGKKIAEFNFNVKHGLNGSYRSYGPYSITVDYTDNSVLITEAK